MLVNHLPSGRISCNWSIGLPKDHHKSNDSHFKSIAILKHATVVYRHSPVVRVGAYLQASGKLHSVSNPTNFHEST